MREPRVKKKKEFSILYVDDEAPNLRGFKTAFRRHFNIHTALSGAEALDIIENNNINIIVSDHRMPEMNGTELLNKVSNLNPDIRRMILSGFIKIEELKLASENFGIHGYVTKPWDFDDLMGIFQNLLRPDPKLITFAD
ncbi:response regulator [Marinoscillum sp. MHG1-6]|uniref:response regulator n=1 Tax=Marinoscillum sp. MHG1-6 TaxID=2959627 RepID=UPI002157DCCB|nr:response regulator [Marinoscillum sp. MHG1-6]